MHNPGSNFNSIWDKTIESNTFTYHLKNLENENLVEKKESVYYLTQKGKEYVAFLEGEDGSKKKKPLHCTGVLVIDDEKILLNQRKREPFYGYYGLASAGKIKFGETIEDSAKRELKEETGLDAELKLCAIYNMITYNEEKISYHHTHFIYEAKKITGNLKESREGKLEWIKIKDIPKIQPIFPDVEHIIKTIQSKKFGFFEMKRYMKENNFTEIKITPIL